ncbi:hypothetical protein SAMN05421811_10163 [Nonomuraea wenchangensis]|uniref:Uncharacterized protein n=1 Tax=Nonomuraea wenchangensis TaxID=568860 RepID=A0A1H9YJI6_9ACTN|nr:hypothetical protein SAMN05421811_10163 [Nonomuraea wenchangensis]
MKNPDNEHKKPSRFWWLPGTVSAVISAARLAYEFVRDHYHLNGR